MKIQKLLVALGIGAIVVGLGAEFALAARKTDGDETRMRQKAAKSSGLSERRPTR
jgi:gas vesicle protein